MKDYRQNSYYRRLQISFLTFVFIPTIVLSLLTYCVNRDNLIEKVTMNNEAVINSISGNLKQLIADITFTSHVIVEDKDVKETLTYFANKSSIVTFEDSLALRNLKQIYSITEMRTLHEDVSVFLVNNRNFIIPSFRNLHSYETLQYHWEQIEQNIDMNQGLSLQWIGKVQNEKNKEYDELYFSRVINDENTDHPIGVLNIAIPIRKLEKLFEQLPHGQLAVYDDENVVVYESALFAENNTSKDEQRIERIISPFNWNLIHSMPKSLLTAELKETLFKSLLTLIFFVAIFLTISLIMARKLHDPIQKLQEITTEFGAGNMDVQFEESSYTEINKLGQSINKMFDQINELIANIKKEQERKKELEINALYSQIRPHFLLNTLNSIKLNLSLTGDDYHSEKIQSLIMLLRKYLDSNQPSTIAKECEFLSYYIDIMNMRNDKDINLDIIISEDYKDFKLPFLILQPIVENSILHGFRDNDYGTITIYTFKKDKYLSIQITDDGRGMLNHECDQLNRKLDFTRTKFDKYYPSESVGLTNVNQRLYLTFGEATVFKVDSEYGAGTTVEIQIKLDNDMEG